MGDTYGSVSKQWDITTLTIARDTGGIMVTLDFVGNVISPLTRDTTAVVGFVDLDTDQDLATGDAPVADVVRPGSGTTGMGADFSLYLFLYADSTAPVYDNAMGTIVGYVRPDYAGKRISVRIARSLLGGDDAFLNAAVAVGSFYESTDIVPNNGHLTVGGP